MDLYHNWTAESMVEVILPDPDAFLKIKETLTRIGYPSKQPMTGENEGKYCLYQSCHILHKQGRYFIVHFKELFCLDGKSSDITINDVQRRNAIVKLLGDWSLLKIVDSKKIIDCAPMYQIKIVSFAEKKNWVLQSKYSIGKKVAR